MKPVTIHLDDVASLGRLAAAFWRAAAGKRHRSEVRQFQSRLEIELERLGSEILRGVVSVGTFQRFRIWDPKPRTIHAPCFRERVLHHSLMDLVGPALDRYLIPDTFACRSDKGPLAAARRAQEHVRRYRWHLKFDIRSYFASIRHDVLIKCLLRRIRGRGVLDLCRRIICSHHTANGCGLPIGALTSQHFANLYLAGLDRYLLEELRVPRMVRYMDDVVIFGDRRARLLKVLEECAEWTRETLGLEIKASWQLQRSGRGLPFCGFVIDYRRISLSRRRKARYSRARRRIEEEYTSGSIDGAELQSGYAAALAITAGATSKSWRRRELARRPAPAA